MFYGKRIYTICLVLENIRLSTCMHYLLYGCECSAGFAENWSAQMKMNQRYVFKSINYCSDLVILKRLDELMINACDDMKKHFYYFCKPVFPRYYSTDLLIKSINNVQAKMHFLYLKVKGLLEIATVSCLCSITSLWWKNDSRTTVCCLFSSHWNPLDAGRVLPKSRFETMQIQSFHLLWKDFGIDFLRSCQLNGFFSLTISQKIHRSIVHVNKKLLIINAEMIGAKLFAPSYVGRFARIIWLSTKMNPN